MIDAVTRKPLSVSGVGTDYPYIRLPYAQLPELRRILEGHGARFWVEERVISIAGGPEFAYVNLARDSDTDAIQAALDRAGRESDR